MAPRAFAPERGVAALESDDPTTATHGTRRRRKSAPHDRHTSLYSVK